jgi:hypothetical protein
VSARWIESAAAVDPIWNRPELVGGRFIRALDEVAVDHDLRYDAPAVDPLDLRRLSECPTGECKRSQKRCRGDRCDAYFPEHLHLQQSVNFLYAAGTGPAA